MSEEKEVINSKVVTTAQEEDKKEVGLVVGYTVGLKSDGNFVFELLGEQKGLIELLGIHQYACTKVQGIQADATMTGDRLTHELGAVSNVLNQKLDALMQLLNGNSQPTESL